MTAARLSTRYRRLLRAYPKGPRREELLDTLMEAAPPGRSRPTPRQAANLIRCGLRSRLGRPGGRAVVVTAVLLVIVAGFVGAAAGWRLGWEFAPDFPRGAALAEINDTVFPGTAPDPERQGDGVFFDVSEPGPLGVLLHGHDEDFCYSSLLFSPGSVPGDYHGWTDAVAARLRAGGWNVDSVTPMGATDDATGALDQDGTRIIAYRGGLSMQIDTSDDVVGLKPGSFDATAEITRWPPAVSIVLAILGWLIAALAGWLLTGWVSRRTEHAAGPVRSFTREPAVIALVLLLPQAVPGTAGFVTEAVRLFQPSQPFWSLSVTWFYGFALTGGLLLAGSVIVAGFAGREVSDPLRETTS
jgi:hypothetical protein